ncbi:MAG: hypothetical protein MZV63_18285 [Marinilabiliales bacterium]|nr:hypothetical protein [Marinilabiliales bacterium]
MKRKLSYKALNKSIMDNWFVGASIGAIPVGILTAILLGTGVGSAHHRRCHPARRRYLGVEDDSLKETGSLTNTATTCVNSLMRIPNAVVTELQQSLDAYGNKHACEQLEQFQE